MLFAENLKRLRENNHLSKSDMAKKLNITPSAYGAYELKRREPSFDMLCKIADTLHVTTDELLGYETDKQKKMMYCLSKLRYKVFVDKDRARLENIANLYPSFETTISNLLRMYDSAFKYSHQGEEKKLLDFFAYLITLEAFQLRIKKMAQGEKSVSKQDGMELYELMLDTYSLLPKEIYLAMMEKLKEKDPKGFEEMKNLVPVWKVREQAERSADNE